MLGSVGIGTSLRSCYQVYLDRRTGDVIGIYEDEDDTGVFPVEENTRNRERVAQDPPAFLEIPVPDHGQRHEWFRAWLTQEGRGSEYFGSIGGWLKEYATEEDRYAWQDYEWEAIKQHAIQVAASVGIELRLQ